MQLLNYREGFACNSSSMHSIILCSDNELKIIDKKYKKYLKENEDTDKLLFGWQEQLLTKKKDKLNYFKSTILSNMESIFNKPIIYRHHAIQGIIDEINNNLDLNITLDDNYNSYQHVDHNSLIFMPYKKDFRFDMYALSWDMEFLKDLKNFILRDDTVIVLDNDNSGKLSYKLSKDMDIEHSFNFGFNFLKRGSKIFSKKHNNVWTLFDLNRGDKIRFTFDEYLEKDSLTYKSNFPELVDLKITNKCSKNCDFCYQGSSKNGKESSHVELYNIIDVLGKNNVFEIALGGGDPLSYLEIEKVIDCIKRYDMAANMTIHYSSILEDHIYQKLSSIAVSCQNITHIEQFILNHDINMLQCYNSKISIQHILGMINENEFKKFIEYCEALNTTVILLGYKSTNRGIDYEEKIHDIPNWLEIIKDSNIRKIGIDTSLAYKYQDLLHDSDIPNYRYQLYEGLTSAYIDGCKLTMAPSSYETDNKKIYSFGVNIKNRFKREEVLSKELSEIFKNFKI